MKTKLVNWHGWQAVFNPDKAVAPYFLGNLQKRINKQLSTNIVFTGEAGIGKSYMAIAVARILEGHTASGKERFSMDQVVFTYKEFLECVRTLRRGKIIVFDEPSYALSHRQWYKELNQALVRTIESFRYKVHPVFIPVINKSLLDKTVRAHLLTYQVQLSDRGYGNIYRIRSNAFTGEVYHKHEGEITIGMMDRNKCSKPTCLGCPKIDNCQVFRAKYERKKDSIQMERYKQAEESAEKTETKRLTNKQIANQLYPYKEKYWDEDTMKIDVSILKIVAKEELGITLGHSKSYDIRKMLEYYHPKDFT